MSEEKPHNQDQVKFLHDLAGPLSILSLLMKKLARSSKDASRALNADEYQKVCDRMSEEIAKLETLHADRKSQLSVRKGNEPQ